VPGGFKVGFQLYSELPHGFGFSRILSTSMSWIEEYFFDAESIPVGVLDQELVSGEIVGSQGDFVSNFFACIGATSRQDEDQDPEGEFFGLWDVQLESI
jgi:hypothetical protein